MGDVVTLLFLRIFNSMVENDVFDKLMGIIVSGYDINVIGGMDNMVSSRIEFRNRKNGGNDFVYWYDNGMGSFYDFNILNEIIKYFPVGYKEARKYFISWFENIYDVHVKHVRTVRY